MNPELVVLDQLGAVGTAIYGLKVAIISMGVVFFALILLIGIIRLMTICINRASAAQNSMKEAVAVMTPEAAVNSGVKSAEPIGKTVPAQEGVPDPAVLAVIAAAVAAYIDTEKRSKVGMIRREGSEKAWVRAGRNELTSRDRLRSV